MRNSKQASVWKQNEEKAKAMTSKFIAAIKKLDCFSSWESLLMEGITNESDKDDEAIIDSIEYHFGYIIIKSDSIVMDMKIEAFREQLQENPYQLKLIA